MVIADLDLKCIPFAPHETNPILLVNPDAVLAGPLASELFQPADGENGQIAQGPCRMDLHEFSLDDTCDPAELFRDAPMEYRLGISGPE